MKISVREKSLIIFHSIADRSHDEMKMKPSTLDIDQMLKTSSSFTATVVHIEATNTSFDNPFGKPIDLFYDGIYDGPILGTGISGLVRECTHKKTGHKYAVKCLDLDKVGKINSRGLESLKSEILIMSELDHPSIVRLEEVYESSKEIYLVQELCVGGELFDKLEEQEDYHYSEGECARLIQQMLSSVRYIHSKGIVHRDLKLENFLFSTKETTSELKLIDFGLSKYFAEGNFLSEAVGTPYTIAPETITGRYDERVDLWAIGVIAYLLLSGETPFGGAGGEEPLTEVRDNILSGKYSFEPEYIWANVSDVAKDFINQLLQVDPEKRIRSAEKAQQHPWVLEWSERQKRGSSSDKILSHSVIQNLVDFKGYSDMRKLLCEVLSFTLLPEQIQDLKTQFEILDVDGSGEISLESLKKTLIKSASAGSLGALMDDEVEEIFKAMSFQKAGATIRWHEFIAACLSLCKVDDRNLRIAFDRLDSDHKGYISLNNVLNLMGYAEEQTKEKVRKIYEKELYSGESKEEGLSYEDFLLLMKGQTKESVLTFGGQNEELVQNVDHPIRSSSRRMSVKIPEKELSLLEMRMNVLEACKRFDEQCLKFGQSKTSALLLSSQIVERNPKHHRRRRARKTRTKSDLFGMGIPQIHHERNRRQSEILSPTTEHFDENELDYGEH